MTPSWVQAALGFVERLYDPATGGFRSVPSGPVTLYGTGYALLTRHYLGIDEPLEARTADFIRSCQDPATGLFVGPELRDWSPPSGALHDREHLLLHLTCATLPLCRQFNLPPAEPIRYARRFCELRHLREWLEARNLRNAWFEGNNLLFIGQLLVHLRDVENVSGAQEALDTWFDWLDGHLDPETGLWGGRAGASRFEAMCGGYHQLLVYYHDHRPVAHQDRLVRTVLDLQHADGGFAPDGGGGACEDVDAVDILVNLYKQSASQRPAIRWALRRCLRHLIELQNADGGFAYTRHQRREPISHMGIPATSTTRGASAAFPTWFRVHTLALLAEVLTDEPELRFPFRFNSALSMGWHRPWPREQHPLEAQEVRAERRSLPQQIHWLAVRQTRSGLRRLRRAAGRAWRRLRRRGTTPTHVS
jgi:hypothetical protein